MKFRVYDNQEKKYRDDRDFYLCQDGSLVSQFEHNILLNCSLDRYTVEMSICDNLFINDVCKEACLVKGTKNGYTGNFSAEVERVVFYNDIEKRYELKAIRMTVDKSIKNPCFELEKYSLPFIPKDIKVTSNIHGGSDER